MSDSPTVNVIKEEKIYPEEDYEYEGTVNGKQWTATKTLGYGATIDVMTPDGVELSETEVDAICDTLWDY